MPIEIKELIVKGTVDGEKKDENIDVVKLIEDKLAKMPKLKCGIDKVSLIDECVQEVLEEIRKQLDY
jgi:hypothetical protein|tara:strand:+ start:2429 stop:2629 length:201 start_codon:yes stop_codon:yes gene_type:complete